MEAVNSATTHIFNARELLNDVLKVDAGELEDNIRDAVVLLTKALDALTDSIK